MAQPYQKEQLYLSWCVSWMDFIVSLIVFTSLPYNTIIAQFQEKINRQNAQNFGEKIMKVLRIAQKRRAPVVRAPTTL